MKVLLIGSGKSFAGSTFSVIYLAKELSKRGHESIIGGKKDSLLLQRAGEVGIRTREFTLRGYLDFNCALQLARFSNEENIQILNPQLGYDRQISVYAKLFFRMRAKVVFTRRQRPRDEPFIKRAFHMLAAEKVVVVSEGLKELFLAKGYKKKDLYVIHNGLPSGLEKKFDPIKVEALRKVYDLEGKTVLGCVSRLKEQHLIIKALPHLDPDLVVLFIGIDREQLEPILKEIQPKQRLIFFSSKDQAEVFNHIKLMSVNILPSKMDGFGLALVEAMALGVPVIGSNFGGIKDIIGNNENGMLFENEDVQSLIYAIKEILYKKEKRRKFIENGLNVYREKFTLEKTARGYEQLFQELLMNEQ